jgi:ubiquinone/menaquinone biosynthesis C-methylase UbiE
MSEPLSDTLAGNLSRFTGLAECYDAYRPQPPAVLVDFLCQMAAVERPRLVVDLGAGTGISTRLWADRAETVIGIEPNEEMRRLAEARTAAWNISYREGVSSETLLPAESADVVFCSQAFHWMEPEPTLLEAARILRPGGVFAAVDCDWPPAIHPDLDAEFIACMARVRELEEEHGAAEEVRRWPKDRHLLRIRSSGLFRVAREAAFHRVEAGDVERVAGIVLSQGGTGALLRRGVSEAAIGLPGLREMARRVLESGPLPWYFTYRLRYGVH